MNHYPGEHSRQEENQETGLECKTEKPGGLHGRGGVRKWEDGRTVHFSVSPGSNDVGPLEPAGLHSKWDGEPSVGPHCPVHELLSTAPGILQHKFNKRSVCHVVID